MGRKGVSGNPKGKPKNPDSAAGAIRAAISTKDWKGAAMVLMQGIYCQQKDEDGNLLYNDDGSPLMGANPYTKLKDKAVAYKVLSDRAFGMPVQKQVVQNIPPPPIDEKACQELRQALFGETYETETKEIPYAPFEELPPEE